jgi:alpha-L-fucosidase 2
LLEAAKKTLAFRLQHGGGHTGWSRAWIINFYARFNMGDTALHHLNKLFEKSTHPNLLDDHPPFQIDGNFGATAGIAEMLLQSQNNYIELLPALPARWQSGYIKGLKARGNYEVEMHWNNGKLVNATVKSITGKPVEVKYGEQKKVIQFKTANAISEVSF